MIIQVTGTGTANKGAELLLIAIQQQLARLLPEAKLAVAPSFGSFDERARYGLRTVLPEVPKGRWWLAGKMMPRALRETSGLVSETDIDAVLDSSGFAFGDQLGAVRVQGFAQAVRRWKKQGKPVILLPQALGPFDVPEIRNAFEDIANHVDLIFARDRTSLGFASQLVTSAAKLAHAPDFTNLVECPSPKTNDKQSYLSLLVPNSQMIAKSAASHARLYIPFLARCHRHLKDIGLRPAVLLHDDRSDVRLVETLRQELNEDFVVLAEQDPIQLKATLGRARLVIGSRFHALVGAMSQAVPAIAVGWSHKYQMLLVDYGCTDAQLSVDCDDQQLADLVSRVMSEWTTRHHCLLNANDRLRQQSQKMWEQVVDVICAGARLSDGVSGKWARKRSSPR